MDCLKNEERTIIPPEASFLLLGEVSSQLSSLAREFWLSEGDANTLSPCHFCKNSVILQSLDPFAVSALLLLWTQLLQLVASKNSEVYNSSHAGMQHCKLEFGCSYHVSTEKVALIVIIGWGKLYESKIWSYWVHILFWLKLLWGHFRHCVSMNLKQHVNWLSAFSTSICMP